MRFNFQAVCSIGVNFQILLYFQLDLVGPLGIRTKKVIIHLKIKLNERIWFVLKWINFIKRESVLLEVGINVTTY
jgi:hypothetical protein